MTYSVNDITGRYADVEGTRTYYEEIGSGPTIFLVHTADACSLQHMYFLPELAKRGLRAVAIDLPGHGKSYPKDWQPIRKMHEYAEFVWKTAKAACPDQKPIMGGASVGGSMTLDISCHHSQDMLAAIALECTAHVDDRKMWCNFTADLEDPAWCPGWRALYERAGGSSLPDDLPAERLTEWRWQHRYRGQEIGAADLQCWVDHDVRGKLGNVTCPVMAFKGEHDYWVPEETLDYIVASIPGGLAEKVVGANMGHYPHYERPAELADIVVDFLRRKRVM